MVVTSDGFVTLPPGPRRGGGGLPFVGSGAEGLGAALAGLGGAVGEITDPNRGLREAIITKAFTDPEFAAELARAQRRAEQQALPGIADARTGVSVPNVLENVGVPIEVTRAIANLSPATTKELTEQQQTRTTDITLQTEEDRQGVLGRLFRAQGKEKIPEKSAEAESLELDNQITARREAARTNLPVLEQRLILQQTKLGIGEAELRNDLLPAAKQIFEKLSPEDQDLLISAEFFGNFTTALQRRQQMTMQGLIAQLQANTKAKGDQLEFTADIVGLMQKVNTELREVSLEALDEGDPQKLAQLSARFNSAARIAMFANAQAGQLGAPNFFGSNAQIPEARAVRGGFLGIDFGLPNNVEFVTPDRVAIAANAIFTGQDTIEGAIQAGMTTDELNEVRDLVSTLRTASVQDADTRFRELDNDKLRMLGLSSLLAEIEATGTIPESTPRARRGGS